MVPGLAQLDSASLERLAAAGDLAEVGAGDVLFREGSRPEALHILLEGKVSLTGTAADASSTVIDILGPASSFVLANVLSEEPYLMGAQAISRSVLVRIAAEPMRAVVASQPAAAMVMMRAMSAELAKITRQVVDLKVRVAAQRLGTYLLSQVKESDRGAGKLQAAGDQGAAGALAGLPRREPLARLHGTACLRRGNTWLPRPAARHLAPEGLHRGIRQRRYRHRRSRRRRSRAGREDLWRRV